MNFFHQIVVASVLLACCPLASPAQRAHHNRFYHRVELISGNLYPFAFSTIAAAYANMGVNDTWFETSFDYALLNFGTPQKDIKTTMYHINGFTAKELFNNCGAGLKLGYQSDYVTAFNWAVFATGHYCINQFKHQSLDGLDDEYVRELIHRMQIGMSVAGIIGGMDDGVRVMLEIGLRYNIPMMYKGEWGTKTNCIQQGLSSHYAVKIAGPGIIEGGIGVYADINHYDLFDHKSIGLSRSRLNNIGITITLTPWSSRAKINRL